MRKSDKLVICGSSLLAIDQRARTMLLNEADKSTEIEIVSGNQTGRIAADFSEAGFSKISCHGEGYLGEWLKQNTMHV